MEWIILLESIIAKSLDHVDVCIESNGSGEDCGRALLAAADAIYSPLKPVDHGLGQARKLAAQLAGLVADYFIYKLYTRPEGDDLIREAYRWALENYRENKPFEEASKILAEAGVAIEPGWAIEARKGIVETLRDYVDPKPPASYRRRREPRRLDPVRDARTKLKTIGKMKASLAKSVETVLKAHGMSVYRQA